MGFGNPDENDPEIADIGCGTPVHASPSSFTRGSPCVSVYPSRTSSLSRVNAPSVTNTQRCPQSPLRKISAPNPHHSSRSRWITRHAPEVVPQVPFHVRDRAASCTSSQLPMFRTPSGSPAGSFAQDRLRLNLLSIEDCWLHVRTKLQGHQSWDLEMVERIVRDTWEHVSEPCIHKIAGNADAQNVSRDSWTEGPRVPKVRKPSRGASRGISDVFMNFSGPLTPPPARLPPNPADRKLSTAATRQDDMVGQQDNWRSEETLLRN